MFRRALSTKAKLYLQSIPLQATQNIQIHKILAEAYRVQAKHLFNGNIKEAELACTYVQIAHLMDNESSELFECIKYESGDYNAQYMFEEGLKLLDLGRGFYGEAISKFEQAMSLDSSFTAKTNEQILKVRQQIKQF